MYLMREQLAEDLDEDCQALDKYGKFGAIGVLFRLTLRGYGYCVVAKGVQKPHLPRLLGEEQVYQHLRDLQGQLVPVCLGIIQLEREYWTTSGAHISHMMVLSYCGEPMWKTVTGMPSDVGERAKLLWAELEERGVEHGDERRSNIVWNSSLQRPMCIDFDWAQIKKPCGKDGQAVVKRRRLAVASKVVQR
jgi:hypothetical protein